MILGAILYGYMSLSTSNALPSAQEAEKAEEAEEPQHNFTAAQLKHFDGTMDGEEQKPIYMSVCGIVFDVSEGRDFYGPEGPYGMFAGRECGVALAKMSFDAMYLDNLDGVKDLNFGEKTELEGWLDKFTHYRPYPIKGTFIPDNQLPDPQRILTLDDLEKNNGSQEVPDGYSAAPIFIGAGDKVFDVSFGGSTFYGSGGPYHKFSGKDATRALGKMSLADEDVATADTSDFEEKHHKTLNDWIKTFEQRKKYPIVGRLKK